MPLHRDWSMRRPLAVLHVDGYGDRSLAYQDESEPLSEQPYPDEPFAHVLRPFSSLEETDSLGLTKMP